MNIGVVFGMLLILPSKVGSFQLIFVALAICPCANSPDVLTSNTTPSGVVAILSENASAFNWKFVPPALDELQDEISSDELKTKDNREIDLFIELYFYLPRIYALNQY
jgi:hypothetical protein